MLLRSVLLTLLLSPAFCFAQVNSHARDSVNTCFERLKGDDKFRKESLELIMANTNSRKDRSFTFVINNKNRIDSIFGRNGYVDKWVYNIIVNEVINPVVSMESKASEEPEWEKMRDMIAKQYGETYAGRSLLDARLKWYELKKEWQSYTKYVIERVEKYGPYEKRFPENDFPSDWEYNVVAWDLFEHSLDSTELKIALTWSQKSIDNVPAPSAQYFDTYANILYKLGRSDEAIRIEEKALAMSPADTFIKRTLEKMKRGEPTWRIPD